MMRDLIWNYKVINLRISIWLMNKKVKKKAIEGDESFVLYKLESENQFHKLSFNGKTITLKELMDEIEKTYHYSFELAQDKLFILNNINGEIIYQNYQP